VGLTVRLAWRNIWRHPRRSWLTIAAIAFAATVLEFFIGVQLKSYDTAINASTRLFHGHVQIQMDGYLDKPSIRNAINNVVSLRAEVQALPAVQAASARAFSFALASSETRSLGVQVVGVEPQFEPGVSSIPGLIKKGAYFSTSSQYEALLGGALAKNLAISVGGELTLLGQGRLLLKYLRCFASACLLLNILSTFKVIFNSQNRVISII